MAIIREATDQPIYDDGLPEAEIVAAADAMRILWESERCKQAIKETGHGASWRFLAQVALTAASMVRGKPMQPAPDQFERRN